MTETSDLEVGKLKVLVKTGDITEEAEDALVVPANSLMLMGGGVAGAVKRKGGQEIEDEARKQAPVSVGEAIATKAGKLKVKYVVHAPTMERPAGETDVSKVYSSTLAALRKADELGLKSISLPGMGTGVGGLDPSAAAEAMLRAIAEVGKEAKSLEKVVLVAFERPLYEAFVKALSSVARR